MRPDRQSLFGTLVVQYGLCGERYVTLLADLEPLFQMADVPDWPEGTGCGFGRPRDAKEITRPIPNQAPSPVRRRVLVDYCISDALDLGFYEARSIDERYLEQICSVLGYANLVQLGSLLGRDLFDPLFLSIAAERPSAYARLQTITLYRVAAAVTGLETEASALSEQLRRLLQEAMGEIEIDLDDHLHRHFEEASSSVGVDIEDAFDDFHVEHVAG